MEKRTRHEIQSRIFQIENSIFIFWNFWFLLLFPLFCCGSGSNAYLMRWCFL